ncbi:MAG: SDR family oxidoreductase [Deltaproteobacteria bacterium]|nr:SDR family oxidoreductase [Deltaproteobacteria bacterium]MBI3016620.1 SDR family oxidoreductase [Deltaproteobacteria bacterium]
MKHAVVTGGAGFLGSHLCDYLLKHDYHVTCIDNFITGSPDNIAHLKNNPHFNFIEHDVTKHIYIEGPVDAIFHFASPASPIDYQKIPIPTLKVGALGTHNALGLAKAKNATILLASTSEVYGDPLVHPQKEDYWGNVNPIGPRGCYDEAKRFLEAMTMAYHRTHGLKTRIVRIFNTYGPRQRLDDGRAIPTFMTQALKGEEITLFGDGNQTRSFCYVDDLIEGIYKLFLSNYVYPVNIGNPIEMTIKQMADKIIQTTQSKSPFVFKPLPIDDPKIRQPDIALAKKILNWEPKVNLEEGLKRSLDYFKRRILA